MLGILIILILSFVFIFLYDRKISDAIGIIPYPKRILQFITGLLFVSFVQLVIIGLETWIKSIEWKLNHPINYQLIYSAIRYHIISALTEDLVFRGALLYIFIKQFGMQIALIFSGIAFGIYHWFSYDMFGAGIIPIVYVFITTGLIGYVWAYTFAKTKSIMMPLGFHFGWNIISAFFLKVQPFGQMIFTGTAMTPLSEPYNSFFSIFSGLFPSIITFIMVKFIVQTHAINGKLLRFN